MLNADARRLSLSQRLSQRSSGQYMNRNCTLLLTSLALGLISLVVALLGGIHLQHIIDNGGASAHGSGRHLGETVALIVLALGLFAGSVWACQRGRRDCC